jgi:hypothetical protein
VLAVKDLPVSMTDVPLEHLLVIHLRGVVTRFPTIFFMVEELISLAVLLVPMQLRCLDSLCVLFAKLEHVGSSTMLWTVFSGCHQLLLRFSVKCTRLENWSILASLYASMMYSIRAVALVLVLVLLPSVATSNRLLRLKWCTPRSWKETSTK